MLGKGQLRRAEVLDRLGVKDITRVAQLSAEEALRLLLSQHKQDESAVWLRFETELTKRINEISERHKTEMQNLKDEKGGLELRLKSQFENQEVLVKLGRTKSSPEPEPESRIILCGEQPLYSTQIMRIIRLRFA